MTQHVPNQHLPLCLIHMSRSLPACATRGGKRSRPAASNSCPEYTRYISVYTHTHKHTQNMCRSSPVVSDSCPEYTRYISIYTHTSICRSRPAGSDSCPEYQIYIRTHTHARTHAHTYTQVTPCGVEFLSWIRRYSWIHTVHSDLSSLWMTHYRIALWMYYFCY